MSGGTVERTVAGKVSEQRWGPSIESLKAKGFVRERDYRLGITDDGRRALSEFAFGEP